MLSKGLFGSIENSWRQWPGESPVISKEMMEQILIEETGGRTDTWPQTVNAKLPAMLGALPRNNDSLFSSLVGEEMLLRLCSRASMDHSYFSRVGLFIGFGASIKAPNVRLPAYILPIVRFLEVLSSLQRDGVISTLPKARLFWAENAASLCNGMEIDEAEERGRQSRAYVAAFLWRFYPELAGQFILSADADWTNHKQASGLVQHLAGCLGNYSGNGAISSAIGKIKAMGRKHGGDIGEESSLRYSALHAIFHEEIHLPFSDEFFAGDDRGRIAPEVVISFGGRTEKLFYQVRRFLVGEMMANGNGIGAEFPLSVQYYVSMGKSAPVYYPDKDGDITLEDVAAGATLETSRLGKTATNDLQLLTAQEGFWDFVHGYVEV